MRTLGLLIVAVVIHASPSPPTAMTCGDLKGIFRNGQCCGADDTTQLPACSSASVDALHMPIGENAAAVEIGAMLKKASHVTPGGDDSTRLLRMVSALSSRLAMDEFGNLVKKDLSVELGGAGTTAVGVSCSASCMLPIQAEWLAHTFCVENALNFAMVNTNTGRAYFERLRHKELELQIGGSTNDFVSAYLAHQEMNSLSDSYVVFAKAKTEGTTGYNNGAFFDMERFPGVAIESLQGLHGDALLQASKRNVKALYSHVSPNATNPFHIGLARFTSGSGSLFALGMLRAMGVIEQNAHGQVSPTAEFPHIKLFWHNGNHAGAGLDLLDGNLHMCFTYLYTDAKVVDNGIYGGVRTETTHTCTGSSSQDMYCAWGHNEVIPHNISLAKFNKYLVVGNQEIPNQPLLAKKGSLWDNAATKDTLINLFNFQASYDVAYQKFVATGTRDEWVPATIVDYTTVIDGQALFAGYNNSMTDTNQIITMIVKTNASHTILTPVAFDTPTKNAKGQTVQPNLRTTDALNKIFWRGGANKEAHTIRCPGGECAISLGTDTAALQTAKGAFKTFMAPYCTTVSEFGTDTDAYNMPLRTRFNCMDAVPFIETSLS